MSLDELRRIVSQAGYPVKPAWDECKDAFVRWVQYVYDSLMARSGKIPATSDGLHAVRQAFIDDLSEIMLCRGIEERLIIPDMLAGICQASLVGDGVHFPFTPDLIGRWGTLLLSIPQERARLGIRLRSAIVFNGVEIKGFASGEFVEKRYVPSGTRDFGPCATTLQHACFKPHPYSWDDIPVGMKVYGGFCEACQPVIDAALARRGLRLELNPTQTSAPFPLMVVGVAPRAVAYVCGHCGARVLSTDAHGCAGVMRVMAEGLGEPTPPRVCNEPWASVYANGCKCGGK